MKEEATIYYANDKEDVLEPKLFDYLVNHNEETKETTVTIGADFECGIECIALTLKKEKWLEIVQGVQEVLDAWEEEDETQMG